MRRASPYAGLLICCVAVASCKSHEGRRIEQVAPSKLRPGPIRHDELPADLVARITKLHDTFQDVDPTPLAKWLDDFKRDEHPDREVEIYEAMARAYTEYCRGRTLTEDAKREVYGLVIARSAAPEDEVLKSVTLKHLSIEDARGLLELYDRPPAPITVK